MAPSLPRRPRRPSSSPSSSCEESAHAQREVPGPEPVVKPGFLGEQRDHAVRGDHDGRLDHAVCPAGNADAAHPAIAQDQPLHHTVAEERDTRVASAFRVPPVEDWPVQREARVGLLAGALRFVRQRRGRLRPDDRQDAPVT